MFHLNDIFQGYTIESIYIKYYNLIRLMFPIGYNHKNHHFQWNLAQSFNSLNNTKKVFLFIYLTN